MRPIATPDRQLSSIRLFENTVPDFAAAELDRLYAHPFAGVDYKRALGKLAREVYTYVASNAVLMFSIDGRRVRVINEFTRLDEIELRRFVAYVFDRFPHVGTISIRAVHTEACLKDVVHQRHADRADIVAELPDSAESYTAALHKATRSTIKARMNKLRREHPDFSWRLYQGSEVPEDALHTLVQLNRERMRAVRKVSYNDAAMESNYLRIARECDAMLLAVSIDGQLCGGALNVRAGQGCFGLVNAFDARYARYSLGMVSAYLSICEAISVGVRRFHFGWDPYEYKSHLLGVPQPSWRFEIYRSPLHLAGAAGHALRCTVNDRVRRAKLWMLEPERRDSVTTRLAVDALNGLRNFSVRMRGPLNY